MACFMPMVYKMHLCRCGNNQGALDSGLNLNPVSALDSPMDLSTIANISKPQLSCFTWTC